MEENIPPKGSVAASPMHSHEGLVPEFLLHKAMCLLRQPSGPPHRLPNPVPLSRVFPAVQPPLWCDARSVFGWIIQRAKKTGTTLSTSIYFIGMWWTATVSIEGSFRRSFSADSFAHYRSIMFAVIFFKILSGNLFQTVNFVCNPFNAVCLESEVACKNKISCNKDRFETKKNLAIQNWSDGRCPPP